MLWIAVLSLLALFSGTAEAATLVVNSTIDAMDVIPGDGSCVTSGGPCSLRVAIEEANAPVGDDTISLPAGTYTLTLGAELTISSNLTLTGAGADTTIIEAATTSGTASTRVINVTGGTVSISGVTIRHDPAPGRRERYRRLRARHRRLCPVIVRVGPDRDGVSAGRAPWMERTQAGPTREGVKAASPAPTAGRGAASRAIAPD